MKRCGRCRRLLELSHFSRAGSDHQHWCKACFGEYFRERGQLHIRQVAATRGRRERRAKQYVADHLARHPCVDCGEGDPVVLEFDHVRGKRSEVSVLAGMGASLRRIAEEIACCEVVCVNCHRRRTKARQRRSTRSGSSRNNSARRRNLLYLANVLAGSNCADCGETEADVLEFDHVRGRKVAPVTRLARAGSSLRSLRLEIGKCEVRCGNCHRRRTARTLGHFRHHSGRPRSSVV